MQIVLIAFFRNGDMPDNQISKKVNFDSIATFYQVSAIDDLRTFSNGILGSYLAAPVNLIPLV